MTTQPVIQEDHLNHSYRAEEKHVSSLVQELCQELNAKKINYCHWKSNAALDRSASGENDLDLLVGRQSRNSFIEALCKLGFKQAREHSEHEMPGVLDFYGFDRESDRLIHVHAHFQLVFGHDATKNFHLPIEEAYLASAQLEGLFSVPSPEFELILLVIRLTLKHSTWDTFLLHQARLSFSERHELEYLLERASKIRIQQLLKEHLPYLDPELFELCLQSLQPGFSSWKRIIIGRKLVSALGGHHRRSYIIDAGLKFWRRLAWPFKARVFRQMDRKIINSGGALIAIVGGDGAGKTTAVNALNEWLSDDFEVIRFHMGKPRWSLLTILVRGIVKIGRSLGLYPFMRAEIQFTNEIDQIVFPGYPHLIRELCTARDRYLTYRKARRLATNGKLVILDRYPLPQIKFMDGPQIAWITSNHPQTGLIKKMARLEEKYYLGIAPPDLLVVLRADPEIAVARKTDETEDSVRARSTEIWKLDWDQTAAYVVDASRPKQEVLSDVKWLIWSHL